MQAVPGTNKKKSETIEIPLLRIGDISSEQLIQIIQRNAKIVFPLFYLQSQAMLAR